MTFDLQLQAENEPAVLERILRITRHRGFNIVAMDVHPAENKAHHLEIYLTVAGGRPIHTLSNQLEKIPNICWINNREELTALKC